MLNLNPAVLWTLAGLFAVLLAGTLVRLVAVRGAASEVARNRLSSLQTWWMLAGVVSVAAVCGRWGLLTLLVVAGCLGLREYLLLLFRNDSATELAPRILKFVTVGLLLLYYLAVALLPEAVVRPLAPLAFFLVPCGLGPVLGMTTGYLRTAAGLLLGLMMFGYGLSHAVFLWDLPLQAEPVIGRVGWFLYVLLLTEANDIMQAITGRRFGRTKITPRVSPNKSLEGLLGGTLSTVCLSLLLAPRLTTLTQGRSLAEGLCVAAAAGWGIAWCGFLGDIHMSAIKRDVGVKDGSALLPGQGGMIDRIDSLIFTAPLVYYGAVWWG